MPEPLGHVAAQHADNEGSQQAGYCPAGLQTCQTEKTGMQEHHHSASLVRPMNAVEHLGEDQNESGGHGEFAPVQQLVTRDPEE